MDLTIKIGGQAGQGIQTVGHFLALVCREGGLFLMAVNDFESRIRGGHIFFQVRISDKPVHAPHHEVSLLIALDKKSFEIHQEEMVSEGLVLFNQAEKPKNEQIASIPFEELAEKAGAKITSNTVAPGSPGKAYETMIRAFRLSENYQVPAIVLTDQHLNDSSFIIENALSAPKEVERFILKDEQIEDTSKYERFALDASGVSPRALPCMGEALVVASSDEHRQDGHISETITNRINMVDKRNSKIPDMRKEIEHPEGYFSDSDVIHVGWGSTKGAIQEAVDILRSEKLCMGSFHFTDLWPVPDDAVAKKIENKKKIIMVEQNSTAQLGGLIRQQTGIGYSEAILKYDGRPFYPIEIVESVKKYARKYNG